MMIVVMVMAVGDDDDGGGDGGWWRLHICGDCGDVSQCTALLVVQSIYKNAYPMYGAKFTMSAAKIQTKYAHRVAFGPMPLWNFGGVSTGCIINDVKQLASCKSSAQTWLRNHNHHHHPTSHNQQHHHHGNRQTHRLIQLACRVTDVHYAPRNKGNRYLATNQRNALCCIGTRNITRSDCQDANAEKVEWVCRINTEPIGSGC